MSLGHTYIHILSYIYCDQDLVTTLFCSLLIYSLSTTPNLVIMYRHLLLPFAVFEQDSKLEPGEILICSTLCFIIMNGECTIQI